MITNFLMSLNIAIENFNPSRNSSILNQYSYRQNIGHTDDDLNSSFLSNEVEYLNSQ